MKYLVKFQESYADEFTVYGFRLMDQTEFTKFTQKRDNIDSENGYQRYFGSNEELDIFSDSFSFEVITPNVYETLKLLFGKEYGYFPDLED